MPPEMTDRAPYPDARPAAGPGNPDPLVGRELVDRPVHHRIMAAADGECPLQNLKNSNPLSPDSPVEQPSLRIANQHQLKDWVARSLADGAAPSSQLRNAIRDMMAGHTPGQMQPAGAADASTGAIAGPSWWWRWSPALAAGLLLLLTLGIQLQIAASRTSDQPQAWHALGIDDGPQWLSVGEFNQFGRRHVQCSRGIESLYNRERFLENGQISANRIGSFLGTHVPSDAIDLNTLGFELIDAGSCHLPGKQSVHLVYQPVGNDASHDTLSLWIAPADAQWHNRLAEGRPLLIDGPMVPHPMAVWRRADLVFFLVSDSSQSSQAAVNLISHPQPHL